MNPDKKFEFPLKAKNFREETISMRNEKYEDWCKLLDDYKKDENSIHWKDHRLDKTFRNNA